MVIPISDRIKELKPVFDKMTKEEAIELKERMKEFDAILFDYGEDELDEFKSEALDWIAGELREDYGNADVNEVVAMLLDWEREETEGDADYDWHKDYCAVSKHNFILSHLCCQGYWTRDYD